MGKYMYNKGKFMCFMRIDIYNVGKCIYFMGKCIYFKEKILQRKEYIINYNSTNKNQINHKAKTKLLTNYNQTLAIKS